LEIPPRYKGYTVMEKLGKEGQGLRFPSSPCKMWTPLRPWGRNGTGNKFPFFGGILKGIKSDD
jgi:hypothetical protein